MAQWKRIVFRVALWVLMAGLLIAVFTTAGVAFGDALIYTSGVCTAGFLFDSQKTAQEKRLE